MKLLLLTILTSTLTAQAKVITQLNAKYKIPLKNETETSLNEFNLENYQIVVDDTDASSAQMSFNLPETVTGLPENEKIVLSITGSFDSGKTKVLSSQQAKAVCVGHWVNMKCSMTFNSIPHDMTKLKEITEKSFSPADSAEKIKILGKFINDPIGLVEIKQ